MNERIKQLRKELGLTLEKFGERIGLRKSSLSQIENGVHGVTEQLIKSICREFNVNENWLRTGEGEMFVQKTLDDEIASFIQTIQLEKDDSFKKKFIKMLSSLDEADWTKLETMFKLCH
ncbi:MAG TPA: XRE family transcriptional regulator [Eubacterium sp.]|nr:XRE family transcriptional regulator [Eubacterium sp.]